MHGVETPPQDDEEKVTASSPQPLLDQSSSTMSTTGPVSCDDPTDRTERGDDVPAIPSHKILQWQKPAQVQRGYTGYTGHITCPYTLLA